MRLSDFIRRRQRRPAILMYHRIARLDHDPWELAVSPENFERQISMIAAECAPLKMSDFVGRLRAGTLRRNHVAITFDDAYLDNLTCARPILARHNVPSTVFAVSDYVRDGRGFWWDEWTRLVLAAPTRADFSLALGPHSFNFQWDATPAPSRWRSWQAPHGARQATFTEAYPHLQKADPSLRDAFFESLRLRLGDARLPAERSMNTAELQAHLANDLFELGSHTMTHPPLARIDARTAATEIEASRDALVSLSGAQIAGIAYPYGSCSDEVEKMTAESGYDWACTTRSGGIVPGLSQFALPRLAVRDWDVETFRRALCA